MGGFASLGDDQAILSSLRQLTHHVRAERAMPTCFFFFLYGLLFFKKKKSNNPMDG